VLALLGPSGCGKSSLLRAVAGLEPAAAGRVSWDGVDVSAVPVHRRGFGLLFQDGQLFAHRDVAGNVGYGLPRGPRRAAEVARLLELVGLPGAERRDVATLSGGERQRVALARSLAPRPRLLLLDEPLSALDRALRERLAGDLRVVLETTGTTAVFVTHDQDEAFAVADRVAVMAAGRLLQVDTPARLWAAPANRAVAEFLGYTTFLRVDDPLAGPVLAALASAPDGGLLALAPGALVVRDPDAGPVPGGPASPTAVVTRVRARRGGTELSVQVEGLGEQLGEVSAAAPAGWGGRVGDQVALGVDPAGVAALGSAAATG
jgi:thiamine transport system ATP-binding protein